MDLDELINFITKDQSDISSVASVAIFNVICLILIKYYIFLNKKYFIYIYLQYID